MFFGIMRFIMLIVFYAFGGLVFTNGLKLVLKPIWYMPGAGVMCLVVGGIIILLTASAQKMLKQ